MRILEALFFGIALACSGDIAKEPVSDSQFDDPDEPNQGSGGTKPTSDGGDAAGRACVANRDCPAMYRCSFPIAEGCSAKGSCLLYTETPQCKSDLACACDGTTVSLCTPAGTAPAPVVHTGACATDASAD